MDHPSHTHRARELRRSMTPAEVILWRELRGRRFAGFKFRRQRPMGPYFADFCCYRLKLIVELDGDTHIGRETQDAIRQQTMESWGYRVLRFWNCSVYDELEAVLDTIYTACEQAESQLSSIPCPSLRGDTQQDIGPG